MKLPTIFATTISTIVVTALAAITPASPAKADIFSGSSSGTWGDPVALGASNPTPVFSGSGTNVFSWGDPSTFGTGQNKLFFAGNTSFVTETHSLFRVGDLTYFNGSVIPGTNVDFVPLNILLNFSNIPDQTFSFDFQLVSRPNQGTPQESADSVFILDDPGRRSFFLADKEFTLELTGFSQDGGSSNLKEFRVLEGAQTTAALYGKISQVKPSDPGNPPEKVPEPGTLAGISLLGGYVILRKKSSPANK